MIAERTNMFDAFAFVAYILIFALAESCMVFLFALAAFPFLPKRWSTIQHTLALGLLSYISASWIILRQLNFWNDNRYGILVRFVDGSTHPLKYGALIIIVIGVSVFLSIFLPILCIDRSQVLLKKLTKLAQRIYDLATIYLILDLLAILLIIYRNLILK